MSTTFERKRPKFFEIADRSIARSEANASEIEREEREREAAEVMRRRQVAVDGLNRDLRERHRDASLRSFAATTEPMRAVVAKLTTIAESIGDFVSGGGSLLFYGPPGSGKDHLAIAMLKAAAREGHSARWMATQMYFDEMADASRKDRSMTDIRAKWLLPKVLCLSDPVMDGTTEANRRELYRLVNERWLDRKCTWVTCNCRSFDEAREMLGGAALSRLMEGCEPIFCNFADYRMRDRQKRKSAEA